MAFRSAALRFCLIALFSLAGQYGYASAFACREAYRGIREDVAENVSSIALAVLDAFRSLNNDMEPQALRSHLVKQIAKVPYLEARLSPGEQALLATRLLDPEKFHKPATRLVERELVLKYFGKDILDAGQDFLENLLLQMQIENRQKQSVFSEAQAYLNRHLPQLKPYQRELILDYLEDAVFVDRGFHEDPDRYVSVIRNERGDGRMHRSYRIVAAFLGDLQDRGRLEVYLRNVKRSGFKPSSNYGAFSMDALWNGGRAAIEAKVARFVLVNWMRITGRQINYQLDAVQLYLLGIFRNPEFQKDPRRFINAENYADTVVGSDSIPGTVAWVFLQDLAAGSRLETFVQQIRDTKYYRTQSSR